MKVRRFGLIFASFISAYSSSPRPSCSVAPQSRIMQVNVPSSGLYRCLISSYTRCASAQRFDSAHSTSTALQVFVSALKPAACISSNAAIPSSTSPSRLARPIRLQ